MFLMSNRQTALEPSFTISPFTLTVWDDSNVQTQGLARIKNLVKYCTAKMMECKYWRSPAYGLCVLTPGTHSIVRRASTDAVVSGTFLFMVESLWANKRLVFTALYLPCISKIIRYSLFLPYQCRHVLIIFVVARNPYLQQRRYVNRVS